MCLQDDKGAELELFSVYVPTNHVYVGDIFLLGKADIIKPNLSVREGLGMPPTFPFTKVLHASLTLFMPFPIFEQLRHDNQATCQSCCA